MKRRNRVRISLLAVFLLCGGFFWSAYRAVRQANLNRQLITAIKQNTFAHKRTEEVLACLKRGADPNARDEPYHAMLSWNRLLVLMGVKKQNAAPAQTALLLALEGEMHDYSDSLLHDVDTEVVKALLQYGADVRIKDRYGRTPLVAAFSWMPPSALLPAHTIRGEFHRQLDGECELALIAAGADVNACDEYGNTALMSGFDCENGIALEEALLRNGADVNAHPKQTTALLYRACRRDIAGCQFLLEHGADVNAAEDGYTALSYAAEAGDEALVSLLLKYHANVNANAGHGKTALMAASEGHCATMRNLLQHGAVVDAPDETGWTALTWAARWGDAACVRLLLDSGADVQREGNGGAALYQQIAGSTGAGKPAIIRLLKAYGMKE